MQNYFQSYSNNGIMPALRITQHGIHVVSSFTKCPVNFLTKGVFRPNGYQNTVSYNNLLSCFHIIYCRLAISVRDNLSFQHFVNIFQAFHNKVVHQQDQYFTTSYITLTCTMSTLSNLHILVLFRPGYAYYMGLCFFLIFRTASHAFCLCILHSYQMLVYICRLHSDMYYIQMYK